MNILTEINGKLFLFIDTPGFGHPDLPTSKVKGQKKKKMERYILIPLFSVLVSASAEQIDEFRDLVLPVTGAESTVVKNKSNFRVIVRNLMTIGAGLRLEKELRDVFSDMVQANWGEFYLMGLHRLRRSSSPAKRRTGRQRTWTCFCRPCVTNLAASRSSTRPPATVSSRPTPASSRPCTCA